MWPRGFSFLILIMELSATEWLLNLDLDDRNCLRSRSWQRNCLRSRSWWRKCLWPKDLILTKEMSVTKGLDLDEGSVCNQRTWSWRRWCLWPRSWSWLRKCLRPMDLILTEEIKGFSSLKPSCYLKKPNLKLVSNWWVFCCSLAFLKCVIFICPFFIWILNLGFWKFVTWNFKHEI